jgi:hypothetical protein
MRKRVSRRPLKAFGKDHNKLIRKPTRIIRIEPMETHTITPPLEECIVLDHLIQRFLSWAHKAKAHPLAYLLWILMHKEVQELQVDTTMVHYLAQSIHMRECHLTILHSRRHHPLCLRVSLCNRLKMMMKKNHEQLYKTPQDLYWCLMTKGERGCRLKACCSTLHLLLSAQTRWNRFLDLGATGFGVSQYPFW